MTTIAEDATALAGASTTPAQKTAAGKRKARAEDGTLRAKSPVKANVPAQLGKKPRTTLEQAKPSTKIAKTEVIPTAAGTTKAEVILKLLRRKKGATIAELQDATGWQAHSVRGFLSASVKKRMGLDLRSEPGSDGIRRYVIAAG